jgi:hypothetical protein
MLCAAAIMSCNNESVIDGPAIEQGGNGIVASTGQTTYFSLELPQNAKTYAGTGENEGYIGERNLRGDIAVFVYDWSGSNATPKFYAYIASGHTVATDKITLKATDGTKKIYVALNLGQSSAPLLPGISSNTPSGEGDSWTTLFSNLNRDLWAGSDYTSWSSTAITSGTGGTANGLIKALAGGSYAHGDGRIYTQTPVPIDAAFVMSNWDNTAKDSMYNSATYTYASTCIFNLKPNVSQAQASITNDPSTDEAFNRATINVQRAVARIALKISASVVNPSVRPISYQSEGTHLSGEFGHFTPWDINGNGRWALGNINKTSTVFQQFTGGSVSDKNYALISMPTPDWYDNFDNIRVFGSGQVYPNLKVKDVKDAMLGVQNNVTDSNSVTIDENIYQYCTENAQSDPSAFQDNSTYLIVGGVYSPEYYIDSIAQNDIPTSPPFISYNKAGIPQNPVIANNPYRGTEFAPVSYPTSSGTSFVDKDTLYYHTGLKVFIQGKANVIGYYAWEIGVPGVLKTITNPENNATVIQAINDDLNSNTLVRYFQGNCFYRVFIKDNSTDPTLAPNEKVLVRRNHIYNVNISKILGPGIADPNDILKPGTNVNPTDTYLSVAINIQRWHTIDQEEEFKGE